MNNELGIVNNERPVFRALTAVRERISFLLHKNRATGLNASEKDELDNYEEIDDFFSYINRIIANLRILPPSY